MVQVVNRSQQVVTAGLRPAPAYSRVVSLRIQTILDGTARFAFSEVIGNRFLLLDVWVKVFWVAITADPYLAFRVNTGLGKVNTPAALYDWDDILPVNVGGAPSWWHADARQYDFHWSMDKRFEREQRRLGLWVSSIGSGLAVADAYASFRISEG